MSVMGTTLDMQINSYLDILNNDQKKALLAVAKTFAQQSGSHYSDEFKNELDSRYEDFENGGDLVGEDEVNSYIQHIIKEKSKK